MHTKPAKEYFSERINLAIELSRKTQELLHKLWGKELEIVRKDREILEKQEGFLKKIKSIEDELKMLATKSHILDKAIEEKSAELILGMCNNLKETVAKIRRELETLGAKEHAVEEKKATEVKEKLEEEKQIKTAIEMLDRLKELEKDIRTLSAKFLPKAKRIQLKL